MSTPHPPERRSDNPMVQLLVSMSGASAPEHETEPPGASPYSVKDGHEADKFEVKGILYVPVFVVIVVGITYALISAIFFSINKPPASVSSQPNEQVIQQNKPLINERFARISSTEPKPLADIPGTGVPQPRLEYLRKTEGDTPTDPPFLRSKLPLPEGNSPELHPEDLRPENYLEPGTNIKILETGAWLDKDHKLARISIDDAIKAVVTQKKLPTRKDPVKVATTSDTKAKLSNAGRTAAPAAAAPVAPPAH